MEYEASQSAGARWMAGAKHLPQSGYSAMRTRHIGSSSALLAFWHHSGLCAGKNTERQDISNANSPELDTADRCAALISCSSGTGADGDAAHSLMKESAVESGSICTGWLRAEDGFENVQSPRQCHRFPLGLIDPNMVRGCAALLHVRRWESQGLRDIKMDDNCAS